MSDNFNILIQNELNSLYLNVGIRNNIDLSLNMLTHIEFNINAGIESEINELEMELDNEIYYIINVK